MAVNSIQVKRFLEFAAKSELNVKKLYTLLIIFKIADFALCTHK